MESLTEDVAVAKIWPSHPGGLLKSVWEVLKKCQSLLSLWNCIMLKKSSELRTVGSLETVKENVHVCLPTFILSPWMLMASLEKQGAELRGSLIWPSKVIHELFNGRLLTTKTSWSVLVLLAKCMVCYPKILQKLLFFHVFWCHSVAQWKWLLPTHSLDAWISIACGEKYQVMFFK